MTLHRLPILLLVVSTFALHEGVAKHRRHHRFSGPRPTAPVILWARTLATSTDHEQRQKAAFKLSQYSQPISQDGIISTLIGCLRDPNPTLRALCAKAMRKAGLKNKKQAENVRQALLAAFGEDPTLTIPITRTWTARGDDSPPVYTTLLNVLEGVKDEKTAAALLEYFEKFGQGDARFVTAVVEVFNRFSDPMIARRAAQALANRAQGQDIVVTTLLKCLKQSDTVLTLTCLGGLEQQGKKDARVASAVEETLKSSDPDVLLASLEIIGALPPSRSPLLTERLLEILQNTDDPDLEEKAILALEISGDGRNAVAVELRNKLRDIDSPQSARVAAALALGNILHVDEAAREATAEALARCAKDTPLGALRSACQLGLQQLTRNQDPALSLPAPSPTRGDSAQSSF